MQVATSVSSLPMLGALRKAIDFVLKLDSRLIVLTPHEQVKKEGGLYDTTPQAPRAAQRFTITVTDKATAQTDGALVHPYMYELSGKFDAQIAVGDTWNDGDSMYRVTELQPKNDYEIRAYAIGFGPDLNYGS